MPFDDSFEEVMGLIDRTKALHHEMKDPQVIETVKLIVYNQMFIDLMALIPDDKLGTSSPEGSENPPR
jgi:hypothetical protein